MKNKTSKNQKDYPVLLIALTIIFLFILSFIPADINLGIIRTKKIDFLIDIKDSASVSLQFQKVNQASFFSSIGFFPLYYYTPDENISGNTAQMIYFFNELKESKGKVRIAHYGDSAIEGDMITSDLRRNLQRVFGGYGAGFLSITSRDTRFRASTRHTFSDDWKTYSITESSSFPSEPGINGSVSVPVKGSWVKYEVSGIGNAPEYFKTIRIFYTKAKKSAITYKINGKQFTAELEPGTEIKQLVLKSEEKAHSFTMTAFMDAQAEFFGVSLEAGEGIYVDNFPLRGNSGLSLEYINEKTFKGFDEHLNYKLIILNFGLNLLSEMSDYTRYEKQMVKAINRMKEAFPGTSFLIISIGDKSVKRGSSFITDPRVPKLIASQQKISSVTGCAFWNLFDAMGGENSMHKWVNASPPLASRDYTHVNNDGAKKIAELITDALLSAYRKVK